MRSWLLAALAVMGAGGAIVAQTQPLLQLQGQPYSGGSMTLHLSADSADVGKPTLLFYGLDPLDPPFQTPKGPFYVGTVFNAFSPGVIPSSGRIDIPFVMPVLSPVLAGIPVVIQGFVPGALSNPAALPLDQPHYVPEDATILVSPNPTQIGLFGDSVVTGDLNGDGSIDIAVGAWFEDAGGVDFSGRTYVFWGPSLTATTTLEPQAPTYHAHFGLGLVVEDVDNDGVDDLLVGEGTTNPPPPTAHGQVHVFRGGSPFSTVPVQTVLSVETGSAYSLFGRAIVAADFNDDGDPDLAIGAPTATVQGLTTAGKIEVYWGPTFATAFTITAPDLDTSGFLGDRLAVSDVNGDGIADLIAGTPRKKLGGLTAMGRAYLFTGPDLQHLKSIDHPLPSGANSRFGNAVIGEDLNGDGIDEVIVTDQRNHAFVFWSPSFNDYAVITRPPDPETGSTANSASFGYFATSGDANGDGIVDIVIGEPFGASKGRVYLSLGPSYSTFHVMMDKSPEHLGEFGWGVHLTDIDDDGRIELLVGSDTADPNGVASSGRVTMFDFDP